MIADFIDEFARYRKIAEIAFAQLNDDDLNRIPVRDGNSIAMIVRHLSGNLLSRFTDFLTTDGEKPWRDRDAEFNDARYAREEMLDWWTRGWDVADQQLSALTDNDLQRKITIRGQEFAVHEALTRLAAHAAYHVGQIVVLARIARDGQWNWISIPKGQSAEYNANPTMEKAPR